MIHDAALPPGLAPSATTGVDLQGLRYTSARWAPADLERLSNHLRTDGKPALDALTDQEILAAWVDTVAAFTDPDSTERRELAPALARCCGLSPQGLSAGLAAVLGGVSEAPARELAARAAPVATADPVLVILASNLPGLAVQSLLPALVSRRPTILKTPTSEPFFTPAFLRALAHRLPDLGRATAALTWPGGDTTLENPLLAGAGRVLAYGEAETLADLASRAPGKVFGYGPRISLAVVAADADLDTAAAGLARDVALFDQRGCLSVHAVFVEQRCVEQRSIENRSIENRTEQFAALLARSLETLAREWPPGPQDPVALAGAQQARVEARMRGLTLPPLPIRAGTVIIEAAVGLRPSPGARTVRIHTLASLDELPGALGAWQNRLQGVALAGAAAWRLREAFTALGASWFAPPGELQTPDALWHNGGVHPLELLQER